jgi:hypothetical protein
VLDPALDVGGLHVPRRAQHGLVCAVPVLAPGRGALLR